MLISLQSYELLLEEHPNLQSTTSSYANLFVSLCLLEGIVGFLKENVLNIRFMLNDEYSLIALQVVVIKFKLKSHIMSCEASNHKKSVPGTITTYKILSFYLHVYSCIHLYIYFFIY